MSIKYYSLDEIHKYDVQYYMIFGERSNGKSHAVKLELIKLFFEKGFEFVMCKRFEEDMKSKTAGTMFEDVKHIIEEEHGHFIKFYRGQWLVYPVESDGKLSDCRVFGHAMAISSSDRIKGGQYPLVKTIVLEEFMSMDASYLPNEINSFINLVSTVFRNRLNCRVYMLGNAISKHSPYAEALGIRLHRMEKGEIVVKTFKNKKGFKTKFAIQRTENVDVFDNEQNKNEVVYNVFGNSGVGSMITTGDFETGIYNLHINGCTLSENINSIPEGKYTIINKNHKIPFYIRYEDYYYNMYFVDSFNKTLAFRECKKINCQHGYIFNNTEQINDCVNIKNIIRFYTKDKYLDNMLEIIINCFYQNNTIFINNECGEDVYNSMRLCGLNI